MKKGQKCAPSTVKRLQRIVMKGCADHGFGGCMPRCESCTAKWKLKSLESTKRK